MCCKVEYLAEAQRGKEKTGKLKIAAKSTTGHEREREIEKDSKGRKMENAVSYFHPDHLWYIIKASGFWLLKIFPPKI